MFLRAGVLLLALCASAWSEGGGTEPDTPAPAVCPAGGPIGAVDMKVRSPQGSNELLSIRTINHLSEGDTVVYSPILRGHEKRNGEVALVLVPAKRDHNPDSLIVTDPKPADKPQEWKVDQTISIVGYVYGPEGLSKKKVRGFLSQDDLLIAQLADYAAKTAQTEALIDTLSNADSSAASVNAALSGFASQYGLSVQIDRAAPTGAQAQSLFAAINPQLAGYDPLTSSTNARISQTASITTAAAALFFGSPIGLAAGGTAMLLDLRAIAFPGTQFRSSFAEPLPKQGLNLCGQRNAAPPHTRVAYIWANRVPNTPAPEIQIGKANTLPQKQKAELPVDMGERDWKYLDRARKWALTDAKGAKTEVPVVKLQNQKALELDLAKANVAPGEYRLDGYWDWKGFEAKGVVNVRPVSDFKTARLEPASQDRLLAGAGKTAVTLEGDDFEFTTHAELKKTGDEFATAMPVPFRLPGGLRMGPQKTMDVQIDTAQLEPGSYALLLTEQGGAAHPVLVSVLPNPPHIDNLPVLANQGAATQHFVLKGERLGLITRLESEAATLTLGEAREGDRERDLTVALKQAPKPGSTYPLIAYLKDRTEPVRLADALSITGPLPLIASSRLSLPPAIAISMNPGEFPAGSMLTALLDVKNIEPRSVLQLGCASDPSNELRLRVGAQTDKSSLQQLSPDQLFLSYDTSALPAGCDVEASIDNGRAGHSDPYLLARIVRFPQIDQLSALPDQNGHHAFLLTGRNLELIEKIGWDTTNPCDVAELPAPVPGQGQKQTLRVEAPEPPVGGTPTLFLWLRGDKTARSTTIQVSPSAK